MIWFFTVFSGGANRRTLNIFSAAADNIFRTFSARDWHGARWTTPLDDGDRYNLMFNPLFVKYFTDVAKTLPIWSSLNCQFLEVSEETASTANCDSYFRDNKLSHEDIIIMHSRHVCDWYKNDRRFSDRRFTKYIKSIG